MSDTIPPARGLRRMLGFSLDWRNGAMLLSLCASALAATALVVTTTVVVKLQKKEAIEAAREIADAKARVVEAELKLAEYRKPRAPILAEHAQEFVDAIKPFAGTRFDMGHAPVGREQWDFAWGLEPLMSQGGWQFVEWPSDSDRFAKYNWTMKQHDYGIANVDNISIELAPDSRVQLLPAATALAKAFKQIGIEAVVTTKNNSSTNVGVIDLLLGEKR